MSTASLPRRAPTARYHGKREALLDAAARLFNEQGVKGATLAGIAGSVGLVTNSITYYYRKKEDLATACFERSIAACDALALAAAAAPDVAGRVADFLRRYAQTVADMQERRQAAVVNFNDIRALPSPQAEQVFAMYTDMFRRVRALLKGPQTAHLGREDLNARAHALLSAAHAMRSWIERYETDEYPRAAERVADLLLHGLAAPGAQWQTEDAERGWQLSPALEGPSEAFLRAATVLVNEQGYRGASVDRISARLNLTKGSFYHHHDNKQDLISACFDRSFAVVRQALRLAEDGAGSGWARACAAGRALVRFQVSADGPLLRATATSALPDEAHRERVRLTTNRLAERMANVVVDGMMDGSIRPLDPSIAAQVTIGTINAAAELHRWAPGVTADKVADLYVRPAFEGLLCPVCPAPLPPAT
jgi:AcrR family transcriptional regulator